MIETEGAKDVAIVGTVDGDNEVMSLGTSEVTSDGSSAENE